VPCWRCGKPVDRGLAACLYCAAAVVGRGVTAQQQTLSPIVDVTRAESSGILRLVEFYAGLLLTSLVWGVVSGFGLSTDAERPGAAVDSLFANLIGIEVAGTALVICACVMVGRPSASWSKGSRRACAAWLGAGPLLFVMLAINLGYHAGLKRLLRLPDIADEIVAQNGVTPLVVGVMCLQPAIVEELFFRYLALGQLRTLMGVHGAVLISSVMFGLAHIGNPLAIPVLTVVGMGLGYARTWGGGLLLPMVLHFGHNFYVIAQNR
jgi:membrane protease YdiL (CAAX protease family)